MIFEIEKKNGFWSKRNFVKLVYLISRVFLAWTFLILWPTVKETADDDKENKKIIESYKAVASQVILEPKNLPVTIDPGGPELIQNNNLDENDEYEDIIMEIQMNRSRGSLRRSSGGSFR